MSADRAPTNTQAIAQRASYDINGGELLITYI